MGRMCMPNVMLDTAYAVQRSMVKGFTIYMPHMRGANSMWGVWRAITTEAGAD